MVSRGFFGRRRPQPPRPIPPGQYLENGFPVLSAGPTPRTPLDTWTFSLVDSTAELVAQWSWDEFTALPQTEILVDIHCVTKVEQAGHYLEGRDLRHPAVRHRYRHAGRLRDGFCDGGYTTNVPTADLVEGRVWWPWSMTAFR